MLIKVANYSVDKKTNCLCLKTRKESISLKEVPKTFHSFAHMYKSLCFPLFLLT